MGRMTHGTLGGVMSESDNSTVLGFAGFLGSPLGGFVLANMFPDEHCGSLFGRYSCYTSPDYQGWGVVATLAGWALTGICWLVSEARRKS